MFLLEYGRILLAPKLNASPSNRMPQNCAFDGARWPYVLCGGDKSSQVKDIASALKLLAERPSTGSCPCQGRGWRGGIQPAFPGGPPALRESYGFKLTDLNRFEQALVAAITALCAEWRTIHGDH